MRLINYLQISAHAAAQLEMWDEVINHCHIHLQCFFLEAVDNGNIRYTLCVPDSESSFARTWSCDANRGLLAGQIVEAKKQMRPVEIEPQPS